VEIVREALSRTGRLGDVPLRSVDSDVGPRTTVRMAVLPDGRLGFRRRSSNDAVVPDSCMVAHPLIDGMLPSLRASGAEEATIRCSTSTGARAIWLHDSKGRDARRAGVSGEPEDVVVDPRASVVERVAGVDLRVSMRSFFQSSARAAELLVAEVRAAAGDEATSGSLGDVVDLYGGIGLFSATVAGPRARTVVVESNPAACADARHNLRDRDAGVVSMQVEQWEPRPAGLVIADPSRTGLGRRGSAVVAAVRAPRVVLVSCDPVAGARDLRMLVDAGYALDSVAVLDLFPWTHHVETVASLTLR
jgi:23S rRNA (uracil1939-C5)-methyltransferase